MSRTSNSFNNIRTAFIYRIAVLLISLISRKVFLVVLNKTYLGLDGTFSNVLTMLSLAELGVGTAIIYSMYKPIAENNEEEILSLMTLYKKLYTIIGIVVAVIGLSLTPFLPSIIKDMPDIPHIYIIYDLFVLNSAISYLFVHKQSIIIANQQQRIVTKYTNTLNIICYIVQTIFLLITRNYFAYLITMIVSTILINVLLARKANKMYPYLLKKEVKPLSEFKRNEIIKNTKAMILHKLGGVVVFGTDNLLIAHFINVDAVGLYSNYTLVTRTLNSAYRMIFKSLTASVGNLGASGDRPHLMSVFWRIDRFTQCLYGFSSICLFALLNPFITIWLGSEYVMETKVVFFIALNFYVTGLREAELMFREAMGLYWYDRYKSFFEALVNLVVSIALAPKFGVFGILVGTFVSTMAVVFWIEPIVLFKHGFKTSSKEYFWRYFYHTVITMIIGGAVYLITSNMQDNLGFFIVKILISCILSAGMYCIVYCRTTEFKYYFDTINSAVKKFLSKGRKA